MVKQNRIKQAMVAIIEAIGEDPLREGVKGTPRRVAEMYAELFSGLDADPKAELTVDFEEGYEDPANCRRHFRGASARWGSRSYPSGAFMHGYARDKEARHNCDNLVGEGELPEQGSNSQGIPVLDSGERLNKRLKCKRQKYREKVN